MHLAQNDHNKDISLADISVMAQADGEDPHQLCATHCPYPGPGCHVHGTQGTYQYCPDKGHVS